MEKVAQKLTDKLINTLQPEEKEYDVWDSDIKGFVLRVYKTGAKTFRYSYRFNGVRKTFTIGKYGTLTTAQARDAARQKAGQVANGIDVQFEKIAAREDAQKERNDAITLEEFCEGDYKDWRFANRKNPEDTMRRLRTCFFDDMGKLQLRDISIKVVEAWKTKRLNAGIKPDTVNRDIADLKTVLTKAIDWEVIDRSPLERLKQSKVDKTPNVRFLDESEAPALRQALISRDEKIKEGRNKGNKWRADRGYDLLPELSKFMFGDHLTPMILLSINTGLRQGELFNLKWEQINYQIRTLTIVGPESKSYQTRHIPLNNEAISVLKDWQAQTNRKNGLIFPNEDGVPFDNVDTAWSNVLKSADIFKFRWHDLRHDFASKLVMAGVDLNTVRELMGHADIKTTLRYAHLAPSHKAKAVFLLDNSNLS